MTRVLRIVIRKHCIIVSIVNEVGSANVELVLCFTISVNWFFSYHIPRFHFHSMPCITFLLASSFCAAKHNLESLRTYIILAGASDKTVNVQAKSRILAVLKNCNKIRCFVCASFVDEL